MGLELGQGTAGIPKALCPDPMVLWGLEGCLSLISAKRLLLFVGKDCPARRQETTPQASHWTLTVSPSHIVHTTPKADRASPQPDLLPGSHRDFEGPVPALQGAFSHPDPSHPWLPHPPRPHCSQTVPPLSWMPAPQNPKLGLLPRQGLQWPIPALRSSGARCSKKLT